MEDPSHRARSIGALVAFALLLPAMAHAAGARKAVTPKPGEIVLLRDVSARPAYRPAPPGMALIVDPSPKREINQALGTGELSDAEYAAIGSQADTTGGTQGAIVDRVTGRALSATLGGLTSGNAALSGTGMGPALGGPMGAIGNATGGIGDHVRGALAQFPVLVPTAVGGPGG